ELRQHRDGAGRRVDPALRLGRRHALHAMHAGLELEPRVRALADDPADDLLVSAVLAFARAQHLDAPALVLGVSAVHPKEIAGEKRRLVAAGPGADLEEQVRVVLRILRHEVQRELALALLEPALERLRLLLAERPHLRVVAVRELLGRGQLLLEPAIRGEVPRHGLELRILARQLAKAILVGDRLRIAQQARGLLAALRERGQFLASRFVHDANRLTAAARAAKPCGCGLDIAGGSNARRLSGSASPRTREDMPRSSPKLGDAPGAAGPT